MPVLNFSKWSPGGNTTLFFPAGNLCPPQQALLARQALDPQFMGGEQAGFTDKQALHLRMAGGEFCVNASRAFGALLAYQQHECRLQHTSIHRLAPSTDAVSLPPYRQQFEVTVSGWPDLVKLQVRGRAPLWQVAAALRLPAVPIQELECGMIQVQLPGITHILLDATQHPLPEAHEHRMAQLCHTWQLEEEPAVGAIWWRERQGQLDMTPLVYVRDARTTFLESACGSGALALALFLSQSRDQCDYEILQPSGSTLTVRIYHEYEQYTAEVDGPVSLVAYGQIWLPEEYA